MRSCLWEEPSSAFQKHLLSCWGGCLVSLAEDKHSLVLSEILTS